MPRLPTKESSNAEDALAVALRKDPVLCRQLHAHMARILQESGFVHKGKEGEVADKILECVFYSAPLLLEIWDKPKLFRFTADGVVDESHRLDPVGSPPKMDVGRDPVDGE